MNGSTVVNSIATAYNADSEITSTGDSFSDYAFAHDGQGHVTSVDNSGTPGAPHVVLSSQFNTQGDRTSLAATIAGAADFINSYGFDALSHMTMVQQQGQAGGNAVSPKEVDLAYNGIGQITQTADYNFIGVGPRTDMATGAYSYNTQGLLSGIDCTAEGGSVAIDNLGWTYDPLARVSTFTSIDGTATYGYDNTSQVVSAAYATATGGHQPSDVSFTWDANGNNSATGNVVSPNNEVTNDGTFTYTFDANGNRTIRTRISSGYASDYQTTYAWDYRNRLTDVEFYDNNDVLTKHVHFVYGVFDHLLATEVDSTGGGSYNQAERYVLDVAPQIPSAGVPGTALALPVLEFDGDQNLTLRNLTAVDRIFAQGGVPTPGAADIVTWMLPDNLGSIRYVLDNAGNPINKIDYDSFGAVFYESDSAIPHFDGFAGGHDDQNTGLVNDYHRWYDPATGRWLSEDPLGFAAADLNLGRYAGNDAVNRADPAGLVPPDGTNYVVPLPPVLPDYSPPPTGQPLGLYPFTGIPDDPNFMPPPPTFGPAIVPNGPLLPPLPTISLNFPNPFIGLSPEQIAELLNGANGSPNGISLLQPDQSPGSIFTPEWWQNWTSPNPSPGNWEGSVDGGGGPGFEATGTLRFYPYGNPSPPPESPLPPVFPDGGLR